MKKQWFAAPVVGQAFINQFPQYDAIVVQLLFNRKLEDQKIIDEFFSSSYQENVHDPFLFNDMEKVVKMIFKAIEEKKKIVVFGDFDADGVTSTAVMSSVLKAFAANVDVYIPHREKEGYGLNKKSVQKLKDNNVDLIITVDCGISNHEEVELIHELGMEIIITDHHYEPLIIPKADAIINAHLKKEKYPFQFLAGVGVAYKVAQALLSYGKENGILLDDYYDKLFSGYEGFEKWLLDLVAIGTVADCVPLVGENRTLVKYGLIVLGQSKRIGLMRLMEVINVNFNDISTITIGYQIAPRINAAGRLVNAKIAYDLLMAVDEEEANKLVDELNEINVARQKLTEKIFREAKAQVEEQKNDRMMIAAGEDWPIGVIGLVAGKLAESYNSPILVMSNSKGTYQGSGRSVDGFNIVGALQSMEDYFSHYGGHAQACGFTLQSNDVLEDFTKSLKELAHSKLEETELTPMVNIDAEINFKQISWKLYEELEKFTPFGEGNPKPLFMAKNVKVVQMQTVGKDGRHLRLLLKQDSSPMFWKSIGFGLGEIWSDILQTGDYIDLVFSVQLNEWNGNRELQLHLKDIKLKDNQ